MENGKWKMQNDNYHIKELGINKVYGRKNRQLYKFIICSYRS